MSDQEHLRILKQGSTAWNRWRDEHSEDHRPPDLSGADLSGVDLQHAYLDGTDFCGANLGDGKFYGANFQNANLTNAILKGADLSHTDLSGARFGKADLSGGNLWEVVCNGTDFRGANLRKAKISDAHLSQGTNLSGKDTDLSQADLSGSYLCGANLAGANLMEVDLQNANLGDGFGAVDLRGVNLQGADLYRTNFTGANLVGANLHRAFLREANLRKADLTEADLREANLNETNLVETILNRANLDGSFVYGASVWKVSLSGTTQQKLRITPEGEPVVTVDDLEVAHFIYHLLCNEKIRGVIDSITSKVVLILGRFTRERKDILDAIRGELRQRNFVPILFDFQKPTRRDIEETVSTLAHMAKFVIADLTDAKSIPQELRTIVPSLPSVPVQPIIHASDKEYGMFEHFRNFPWVLSTHEYRDLPDLIANLSIKVIEPAEAKAKELNH